jgi:nitrogen fixation NifU-like protein
MYSPVVVDHFSNPRNAGIIEDADGEASVENPACGDTVKLYLKVEGNRIREIRFQTFGCSAAIAASSMVTEMVKGKTLDEALSLSNTAVADALGGLPPSKMHCSHLAANALHCAVRNYLDKKKARKLE